MKKVAIILINYNQSEMTLECINSLLCLDYNHYNVYLIDNGSNNLEYMKLKKSIKSEKVKIFHLKKNTGYVGGVNAGLKIAAKRRPCYFLIMNNDSKIDRSALNYLVDKANKKNNSSIVSGKVYHYDHPEHLQFVGQWKRDEKSFDYPGYVKNGFEKDTGQYDYLDELEMTDDIYWLLPFKIFQSVGYYSTNFFLYGEQNDYVCRAIEKGYKINFEPRAKMWHKGGLTTANLDKSSPKIVFWKTTARLKLIFLYTSSYNFYIKCLSFLIKNIFLYFFKNNYLNKKNRKLWKVNVYSFYYFLKWLILRRRDNGYNPF